MTEAAPLERMQVIADYRTARKLLLKSGQMDIIIGCVMLLNGGINFNERILDYLYLCLGAFVLLAGMYNRFCPSALGFILDGILLITVGLWNLSLQVINLAQGNDFSWFIGAFGAILILVAFKRFQRYPRVKAAFDDPPTDEQIAWFDDVIKEIHAAKPDSSDDLVQFTSGLKWKGKRFGGMAFFVDKADLENLIVDPRDIEWTDKGKMLFGSNRHIRLRIGERNFASADISPEMLLRFESWKTEAGESGEMGDGEPRQAQ